MIVADMLFELSEGQKRQYIDAETVFMALSHAKKLASEVRGSMFWRDLRGTRTLIRTSAAGSQKSLGARLLTVLFVSLSNDSRKFSRSDQAFSGNTELFMQAPNHTQR